MVKAIKKPEQKKIETLVYNIIMFALIFALVISFVFTIDKLVLEKPKDECYLTDYSNYISEPKVNLDQNCSFDEQYINSCVKNGGNIIYKKDCQIECSYCYKEYNTVLETYNNRINIGRIILTFLLALIFAFTLIKDQIIRYSILTASLVSLFIATISAINLLDKMLPLIIIGEFLLVIFIYRKTSKEKK